MDLLKITCATSIEKDLSQNEHFQFSKMKKSHASSAEQQFVNNQIIIAKEGPVEIVKLNNSLESLIMTIRKL